MILARRVLAAGILAVSVTLMASPDAPIVTPLRATQTLRFDPDDPAIWVDHRDRSRSLILGTVKVAAPDGGLAVFGLDGKLRQVITGADRPNNVDVEYGLSLGGVATDLVVLTERLGRRLRAYAVSPDGRLTDVSSESLSSVLAGAPGNEGAPMGIGLYKRPADGAIFAIVSPKAGPAVNYLWQYRLADDGRGRVAARFVRRFGHFSGLSEIEAVAVDDQLGFVYYADEQAGIHKWHADPDAPAAATELALFAASGYAGDREGIAIYARPDGTGYIVSVEQLPRESVFHVYRREGEPGRPHDHGQELATVRSTADATDGIEVLSESLGPDFQGGLAVAMNSAAKNFLLIRWSDIAASAGNPLNVFMPPQPLR